MWFALCTLSAVIDACVFVSVSVCLSVCLSVSVCARARECAFVNWYRFMWCVCAHSMAPGLSFLFKGNSILPHAIDRAPNEEQPHWLAHLVERITPRERDNFKVSPTASVNWLRNLQPFDSVVVWQVFDRLLDLVPVQGGSPLKRVHTLAPASSAEGTSEHPLPTARTAV